MHSIGLKGWFARHSLQFSVVLDCKSTGIFFAASNSTGAIVHIHEDDLQVGRLGTGINIDD